MEVTGYWTEGPPLMNKNQISYWYINYNNLYKCTVLRIPHNNDIESKSPQTYTKIFATIVFFCDWTACEGFKQIYCRLWAYYVSLKLLPSDNMDPGSTKLGLACRTYVQTDRTWDICLFCVLLLFQTYCTKYQSAEPLPPCVLKGIL